MSKKASVLPHLLSNESHGKHRKCPERAKLTTSLVWQLLIIYTFLSTNYSRVCRNIVISSPTEKFGGSILLEKFAYLNSTLAPSATFDEKTSHASQPIIDYSTYSPSAIITSKAN